MQAGGLPGYATAGVVIDRNVALGTNTGSKITVNYPFSFMVLNGVAKLVAKGSTAGKTAHHAVRRTHAERNLGNSHA